VPSGVMFNFVPIAYLASQNGLTTNASYLGRYPRVDAILQARLEALHNNRPDPDFLYIVPEQGRFDELARCLSREHGIGLVDGYHVIAPYWFAGKSSIGAGPLVPASGTTATPPLQSVATANIPGRSR
jgi:hypothetical protein